MKVLTLLLLAAMMMGCDNKHGYVDVGGVLYHPDYAGREIVRLQSQIATLKNQPWNVNPAPTHTYIVWREDGKLGKRQTVFEEDAIQTKSTSEMLGVKDESYIHIQFVSGKNHTSYESMRFFACEDSAVAWIRAQQDTFQWHVALMSIVLDVKNNLCPEVQRR